MPLNLPAAYIVICQSPDGAFIFENDFSKSFTDSGEIVRDIADGQYGGLYPISVYLAEWSEGTIRDVTEDIGAELVDELFRRGEEISHDVAMAVAALAGWGYVDPTGFIGEDYDAAREHRLSRNQLL